jgi:hypothetical protein
MRGVLLSKAGDNFSCHNTYFFTITAIIIIIIIIFSAIWPLGLFRLREFIFLKILNLFRQLVGLLGRVIGLTQSLYLHRTTQHTSMPQVGFDPTIRVFERPKALRASDRSTTGTGCSA